MRQVCVPDLQCVVVHCGYADNACANINSLWSVCAAGWGIWVFPPRRGFSRVPHYLPSKTDKPCGPQWRWRSSRIAHNVRRRHCVSRKQVHKWPGFCDSRSVPSVKLYARLHKDVAVHVPLAHRKFHLTRIDTTTSDDSDARRNSQTTTPFINKGFAYRKSRACLTFAVITPCHKHHLTLNMVLTAHCPYTNSYIVTDNKQRCN